MHLVLSHSNQNQTTELSEKRAAVKTACPSFKRSALPEYMLLQTWRLDRQHADTPYSASLLEHKFSGKSQRYLIVAWHFPQSGPLFCQNSDSDDNNRETAAAADVNALRREYWTTRG
jgi:hypothetical protein